MTKHAAPKPVMTACDVLAAHPADPDKVASGVSKSAMDKPRAIEACRAAVALVPDNGRLNYQLARALFYSEHFEEAMPIFEHSAAQGYRQSHLIIGLIVQGRNGGIPYDAARLERHWREGARLGHHNCQVCYVHAAMRGEFDGLAERASDEEMLKFLAAAKPKLDYLAAFLADDLADTIRARQKP